MRIRLVRRSALFAIALALCAAQAQPPAAPTAKPVWLNGFNLKARPGGVAEWEKAAKIGVEINKDTGTNALLAVTENGNLAVVAAEAGAKKVPEAQYALDLKVRKANEDRFTKETFTVGVEAFKDSTTGKLIYLSEKKGIAFADAPAMVAGEKNPIWQYGLILKVRKPEEKEFGKETARFGLEIFKDEYTGGLIFAIETGSLAAGGTAAPKPPEEGKVIAPKALYGMSLRARKADEAEFTKAKKYGIEVYKDENSGQLIYISETGSIAVVPPPAVIKDIVKFTWKHALKIKARPAGIEFDKAPKYGIEVFEDGNTGYLIYLSETGSIAVLKK